MRYFGPKFGTSERNARYIFGLRDNNFHYPALRAGPFDQHSRGRQISIFLSLENVLDAKWLVSERFPTTTSPFPKFSAFASSGIEDIILSKTYRPPSGWEDRQREEGQCDSDSAVHQHEQRS